MSSSPLSHSVTGRRCVAVLDVEGSISSLKMSSQFRIGRCWCSVLWFAEFSLFCSWVLVVFGLAAIFAYDVGFWICLEWYIFMASLKSTFSVTLIAEISFCLIKSGHDCLLGCGCVRRLRHFYNWCRICCWSIPLCR